MNKPMNKNKRRTASYVKRLALAAVLVCACVLMSACYYEPDRVVDDPAINIGGNQEFQTVVTNTPVPTNTPSPTPTADTGTNVDWSGWTFDNPTNPPAGQPTNPPSGSTGNEPVTITVGPTNPTPTPPSNSGGSSGGSTSSGGGSSSGGSSSGGTSTTSSTLKQGDKGDRVKEVQQRLKELGYYKGSVDGDFGSGTTTAVINFQKNNGLSADGKVGPATRKALFSNNAIKAGAGNANQPSGSGNSGGGGSSSGGSSSKPNTSEYTNGRTDIYLKLGSSGSQVKILQNRLIVLGYLTGTADGEFGETTEAAVKAFQKRNSIYDDGIAGPDTLTKLYSSSAKKASSVVANLGTLRQGENGAGVRTLQKQLKTLGYYNGSVDGDYGEGTVAAVTAFQVDHNLTPDGIAGKATQNAIYAAVNGGGSTSSGGGGTSSGGASAPSNYGKTAKSNGYTTVSSDNGNMENVAAIQSALHSRGYYSGSLDGDYGSGTEQAVRDFQSAMGLRVTGMAGPTTQRLLYGGTNASGSYSKLEPGSTGSKVKTLQYTLYELKYYDGDITGNYDPATENAVIIFQLHHDLEADGIAGQKTQQVLYSSDVKPFED